MYRLGLLEPFLNGLNHGEEVIPTDFGKTGGIASISSSVASVQPISGYSSKAGNRSVQFGDRTAESRTGLPDGPDNLADGAPLPEEIRPLSARVVDVEDAAPAHLHFLVYFLAH